MIREQMWKRLRTVQQRVSDENRKPMWIFSSGVQETKEVDALIERWQSGEPMERFGGVYDEERVKIVRVVFVHPGEVKSAQDG